MRWWVCGLSGRFKLITSLVPSSSSKLTYRAPSSNSSLSLFRLWYCTLMPNVRSFRAMLRPIPPMPSMPRTLPSGSCPMGGAEEPRKRPLRKLRSGRLKPRRAPRVRKTAVSAVASSTAVGTLETWMECAVQMGTSIWS